MELKRRGRFTAEVVHEQRGNVHVLDFSVTGEPVEAEELEAAQHKVEGRSAYKAVIFPVEQRAYYHQ